MTGLTLYGPRHINRSGDVRIFFDFLLETIPESIGGDIQVELRLKNRLGSGLESCNVHTFRSKFVLSCMPAKVTLTGI